jgi:Tol biopolymer transport system component
MKEFLFLILILSFIISCSHEDFDKIDGADDIYTPYLTSTRDDQQITLRWGKPGCAYCGFCICPQLEPDYFEVLMSDTDPSALQLHTRVKKDVAEMVIGNLSNGKPYYFAVRAGKIFRQATVSRTIMTIPDIAENIQGLFPTVDTSRELGTWSPDQSSVAYISDYTPQIGGGSVQSLLISTLSINTEWLVEISSRSPDWSPAGNKIVYQTDNNPVSASLGRRTTHISVLDLRDSSITRLTEGDSGNYFPCWSPDGNWVAFFSDRAGGPYNSGYSLWKIPSDGGTAVPITTDSNDLNDGGILYGRSPGSLSWSQDGNIAVTQLTNTDYGYVNDIYAVPSSGGSRAILVSSPWDDLCPAYSPDGNTLAFISNRSGNNEIWTLDLKSKQLRQITGSTGKWIYENSGKLAWSASNDKILFTSYSAEFKALYSVDVK